MIPVVNTFTTHVSENRRDITAMQEYLAEAVEELKGILGPYTPRREDNYTSITQKLRMLAMHGERYAQEAIVFHRKRISLEQGWISSELAPPKLLSQINLQLKTQGRIVEAEWIYRNVGLDHLESSNNTLYFVARIPVLSTDSADHYATYDVEYIPRFIGPNVTQRIDEARQIALSKETRRYFMPQKSLCQGGSNGTHNLLLCIPAALITSENCLYSLINQALAERKDGQGRTCNVLLEKNYQDLVINRISPNQVVISPSRPIPVTEICPERHDQPRKFLEYVKEVTLW